MSKLTEKNKRFCEEYLIDLNATQAALRSGYSADTAGSIGHDLLKKTEIQEYLSSLQSARSERTSITADKVLRELARIGFADTNSFIGWNENGKAQLVPSAELSEDDTRAVSEISRGKFGLKIKLHDKVAALEKIGKHLKLFTDVSDVNNTHTFTQMGRIKAMDVDNKGNQVKSITLNFDVGDPVNNGE